MRFQKGYTRKMIFTEGIQVPVIKRKNTPVKLFEGEGPGLG